MAVSEAQKRASNKYQSDHMKTIGCKLKKAEAEKFQAYASARGKTPNAVLKDFIMKCIEGDATRIPEK